MAVPQPRSLPVVAVIADDQALRDAICFSLIAEGYPVRSFEDGHGLLAADKVPEVGCFVIDHSSHVDAVALIEHLAAADFAGRPVVIATRPAPAMRDACWRLGAPIVEKPILGDTLNACISGLLAERPSSAGSIDPDQGSPSLNLSRSAQGADHMMIDESDGLTAEELDAALKETPRGAFALAGVTVALLMLAWLAIYLFVFLPRGAVG